MLAKIVLTIIVLVLVPLLVGNGVCSHLDVKQNIIVNYIVGWISIWALFQFISVPFILKLLPFNMVIEVVCAIIALYLVYCWFTGKFEKYTIEHKSKKEKVIQVITIVGFVLFLFFNMSVQHTDADDSRFVVNAGDMIRTNTMFLTDPSTGATVGPWWGELKKDITSPWAAFAAMVSSITGIKPVVVFHSLLPIVLMCLIGCVYWQIANCIFKKDKNTKYIFMFFMILLNIFGYYSVYGAETFMLTRIWQGKAVVASFGIPAIIWISMKLYEEGKNYNYFLLSMTQMSMCLMSGMGISIGAIMGICFGISYGVEKKSWRTMIKFFLTVIPNIIYALIYFNL